MPQTSGQRQASHAVAAEMARREWSISDLATLADLDVGTVGDFLNGQRWPKTRTQGRLEKALGWEPGQLRALSLATTIPTVRPPDHTGDYAEAPGERRQVTLTEEQLEAIVKRAVQDALSAALPMDSPSQSQ